MVNLVQRCDLAAAADCIDSERNDVAAIVETSVDSPKTTRCKTVHIDVCVRLV